MNSHAYIVMLSKLMSYLQVKYWFLPKGRQMYYYENMKGMLPQDPVSDDELEAVFDAAYSRVVDEYIEMLLKLKFYLQEEGWFLNKRGLAYYFEGMKKLLPLYPVPDNELITVFDAAYPRVSHEYAGMLLKLNSYLQEKCSCSSKLEYCLVNMKEHFPTCPVSDDELKAVFDAAYPRVRQNYLSHQE